MSFTNIYYFTLMLLQKWGSWSGPSLPFGNDDHWHHCQISRCWTLRTYFTNKEASISHLVLCTCRGSKIKFIRNRSTWHWDKLFYLKMSDQEYFLLFLLLSATILTLILTPYNSLSTFRLELAWKDNTIVPIIRPLQKWVI